MSEIIVGVVTDVVLRVYVGGANPIPTSDDITWTHNGSPLPSSPHYVLRSGNTELVISNAPSNTTTGCYDCSVTTTQGTSLTRINISYYGEYVWCLCVCIVCSAELKLNTL